MAKIVKKSTKEQPFVFGKQNLYILGIAILLIIIGYIIMAQPPVNNVLSITIAPIILVIAYLIVIPFAILYEKKKKKSSGE